MWYYIAEYVFMTVLSPTIPIMLIPNSLAKLSKCCCCGIVLPGTTFTYQTDQSIKFSDALFGGGGGVSARVNRRRTAPYK